MSEHNDTRVTSRLTNGRFGKATPNKPMNAFERRMAANRAAIRNVIGPEEIEALRRMLLLHQIKEAPTASERRPRKAKQPKQTD